MQQNDTLIDNWPVAALIERRLIARRQWSLPSWRLAGVVVGAAAAAPRPRVEPVGAGPGVERYLWRGLRLQLYRDGSEAYAINLSGAQPSVYLICGESDGDGVLRAQSLSVDGGEAGAWLEGDGTVLQAPMPAEIATPLRAWLAHHWCPEPIEKRRRQRWAPRAPDRPPDRLGLRGTVLGEVPDGR